MDFDEYFKERGLEPYYKAMKPRRPRVGSAQLAGIVLSITIVSAIMLAAVV